MKKAANTVITREQALQERETEPIHPLVGAQPINSHVTLTLTHSPEQPTLVLRDRNRDFTWRVAMEPTGETGSWSADIHLPSVPTMLYYHFAFSRRAKLFALRQVESLIPNSMNPSFGEWKRQPYQITVYDPAAMPPESTYGQVIYQIFPDRFNHSGRANMRERTAQHVLGQPHLFLKWGDTPENPPQGRDFFGGNLRGITEKLDYLKALGIDCVYITPIFESPTNHRYDAMDYFQIDPMLGSEEDLAELIEEVHARDMRIVLDAVCNHCSNDSRYFNQAGWYGEDSGAYRSRTSPYYRMFDFKRHPKQYTGWVGVTGMPEFVETPEHEALFLGDNGVIPYWMRLNIDGWRTDVTPWMSDEFWRRFRRAVRAIKPDALIVAEEWQDASHYLVGDSFDATMNYRLAWALRGFFALDALSAQEFDERLAVLRADTPPAALLTQVNLISSHDTARPLTVCGGDVRRVRQMMTFLFAYPGSPMLYYGDEVSLEGAFAEDGRRTFPWGSGDESMREFVTTALAYRRSCEALRTGDFAVLHVDERTRTYAFMRTHGDQRVIAAFNASDSPTTFTIPLADNAGQWESVLGTGSVAQTATGLTISFEPRESGWFAR